MFRALRNGTPEFSPAKAAKVAKERIGPRGWQLRAKVMSENAVVRVVLDTAFQIHSKHWIGRKKAQ